MKLIEKLMDKIIEYTMRQERMRLAKNYENKRRMVLEEKKKIGLTDEERIHPSDSSSLTMGDYITNVEEIASTPRFDEHGKRYTEYHHRVTYIDGSCKDFLLSVKLSSMFPTKEMEENCLKHQKTLVKK